MSTVTVLKRKLAIFEKKFMCDEEHELSKVNTQSLLEESDRVFAPRKSKAPMRSDGASLSPGKPEMAPMSGKTGSTNLGREMQLESN